MLKSKHILLAIFFILLVYTRLVNIDWGLPYPFHPDERNMANAIQSLNCEIANPEVDRRSLQGPEANFVQLRGCLNPHFFAYGQFPLYLGFLAIKSYQLLTHQIKLPISLEEAILSLRIISAISSVLNVLVILKVLELITSRNKNPASHFLRSTFYILPLIFSPFFIQFSHFGTTESLLMLLYSLIIYLSLKDIVVVSRSRALRLYRLSFICGIAIATKVSSLIFVAVPMTSILICHHKKALKLILKIFNFLALTLIFSIVFSPHNLLSIEQFLGALRYESDVALGLYVVFYTRQFVGAIPVIFQFIKIFPHALGWPVLIFGVLGFLVLSWKRKEFNLLRLAFLIYFIPNAFLFAKWTRFMAPVFPLILLFAVIFLINIKTIKVIKIILISVLILPGIAYISVYQNPDVRFTASDWIYKNIPDNSYILSETANVVDIPVKSQISKLKTQNYNVISFNFYDLDANPQLQDDLKTHLQKADYIFIPSRRIFKNHSKAKYPILNDYYDKLFTGKLGFKQVAEFNSYPKIELFGKTLIEFPDESAEETWSVFDHPVVSVYKRA